MNHWRNREKQDEENGYKISAIEFNKGQRDFEVTIAVLAFTGPECNWHCQE